jgi:hypothetical protein
MTQTIKRIKQLKVIESFIQADFVKGFKYVDKAGEIVNMFYEGNTPPVFEMNLNGLTIQNIDKQTREIKISPFSFWAHFTEPGSLYDIFSLFEKKLEAIVPILSPAGFRRLGWRNYFVHEFSSEKEREKVLIKFLPNKLLEFNEISLTSKTEKISSQISIKKVFKKSPSKTAALLLDVDHFISYEDSVDLRRIEADLREIKSYLDSQDFLGVVNCILSTR